MNAPSPESDCPRCGGRYQAIPSPERLEELASESPMPASLRAGEVLLRRRLSRCAGCDSLREQVLCARCGCFVRLRAELLTGWCPSPAGDKWAGITAP
ncbi:MAG: DUF6171 family protein [Treponema sp.]|nr:DUF6171 family protein [Treponema sp.]